MKPRNRTLLTVLTAAGIAFAGSYVTRRSFAPARGAKAGHITRQIDRSPDNAAQLARSWTDALANPDAVVRTEQLLEVLDSADAAAVKRWAIRYAGDPELLKLILRRWAVLDPREAARWIEQAERDGLAATGGIDIVIESWALHDPESLKEWFKEPAHVWQQYRLMERLTGAVFARDPAAALALAKEFPGAWRLPPGALAWAREDPAAAANTMSQLPIGTFTGHLLDQAVGWWTEKDPAAAAAWAAALLNKCGNSGAGVVCTVLEKWVERDPAAATAFLKSLPPGQGFALDMANHWAKTDPKAALAWIATDCPPAERGRMMTEVVRAAAQKDLAAAVAFVAQLPDGGMRDTAQVSVAAAWAEKDPAAAVAWTAELSPGAARYSGLISTVAAWSRKDSAAAAAWVSAAPEGTLPAQAYGSVMDSLRSDRAAAYAWLNGLPESGAYSAISHFSGTTGKDAIAALELPDGRYKTAILERTVSLYFGHDPDNAVAWVASLPAGPERDSIQHALEAAPVVSAPGRGYSLTEAKKQELLQKLK